MGSDKYKEVGSARDVKVLNPDEQKQRTGALSSLKGLSGNYQNILSQLTGDQMNALFGNVQNAASGYGAIGQNITSAANAFGDIQYDPEAANRALLNNMSGYSNAAQQAANQALSGSNQSARELATQTTQDAMRTSANELASAGLLGSGAANQAMLEATYTPQAQLTSDLANMQSNYQGNVLGSLMSSGANLLGTGYQTQNANALAAAQAGLTGATSQLDVANSNIAAQQNVYNTQLQNLLAQMQGVGGQADLYTNIAGLTAPQYYTPQYAKQPGFLDYLTGAGTAAAGAGLLLAGL